jgi:DNA-directed RNA polymerase subunit F
MTRFDELQEEFINVSKEEKVINNMLEILPKTTSNALEVGDLIRVSDQC